MGEQVIVQDVALEWPAAVPGDAIPLGGNPVVVGNASYRELSFKGTMPDEPPVAARYQRSAVYRVAAVWRAKVWRASQCVLDGLCTLSERRPCRRGTFR